MDQSAEHDVQVIPDADVEVLDAHGDTADGRKREPIELSPVTILLVASNILVYLLCNLRDNTPPVHQPPIDLAYWPGNGQVFPQMITYMFVHADLTHLLFNLVVIFSFGWIVEKVYGSLRYLFIYLLTGIVAALSQTLLVDNAVLIGASGAASGILAIFVRHFPKARVSFFFIIPMPAWVAMIVIVAVNIFGGLTGGIEGSLLVEPNVGYVPHLAGLVAGPLLSLIFIPPGKGIRWVIRSRRP